MLNIEAIKTKNVNNNIKIRFSGHNLSKNSCGEKIYKFYLPKFNFDEAKVVVRKFPLDDNGNINVKYPSAEYIFDIPQGSTSTEINPDDINLSKDEILAYRFIIDGKTFNDKHKGLNYDDKYYNLADLLTGDVLENPKTIYHLLPNSFNPKLSAGRFKSAMGELVTTNDATARVNHFTRMDTGFDDIIEKIPYIKQAGFRTILSSPVFGQDNLSNAAYWTNNPYQISDRFGTMNDYKRLQIELFKNSLSFIADGAFSSEGLQGIHYRDVLRNGENSPFYKWFTLSGQQALGVLPYKEEISKYIDIRIVNSPIIWAVDSQGLPTDKFGLKNKKYNPNKETFIQIFDKRLTSENQLSRDEVFTMYDIKNPQNPDDISTASDSVVPYSFPVRPDDVEHNAEKFLQHVKFAIKQAQKNTKPLAEFLKPAKDFLITWPTFSLVPAEKSSGATLWDGNKDIIKLKYTLPAYVKQRLSSEYADTSLHETEKTTEDVQNYIIGVGKFWTDKTAKILREYIANQFANATKSDDFKRIIDLKAGSDLPASTKHITEQQIVNALESNYKAIKNLECPMSITQAFSQYPLEALEVSDELTSILAYPSVKDKINKEVYSGIMEQTAVKILSLLNKAELPCGNILSNDRISPSNNLVFQLISDDITRFLLIKGLSPKLQVKDIFCNNVKLIRGINLANIGVRINSQKEREDKLLNLLKYNIASISDNDIQEFVNLLQLKLANITNDKLKVANLIIDKTEAGLNWRIDAAKDIADKDNHVEGFAVTPETWEACFDFWKKFNNAVRLYNPHAYKIGEYTDTNISNDMRSMIFPTSGVLGDKTIEQSGFTTQSNYNYLYSLFLRFFSGVPERNGEMNQDALNLILSKFDKGWNDIPGYFYSGSKNNIVYSHAAVGNQDKPRITTNFSINSLLLQLDKSEFFTSYETDPYWENIAAEISQDLKKSSLEYTPIYQLIEEIGLRKALEIVSPKNLAKLASYTDAFSMATKDNPKQTEIMQEVSTILYNLAATSNPHCKTFSYKNFEDTYSDILQNIQADSEIMDDIKKLQAKVHDNLTKPAQIRNVELARLMVALPCNPALYAGDELLETGGEEKAKNISLQNRGRLHWEYLDNPEYVHIQKHKDEISKIFNLRNDEHLTSLVNGDTILLKKQNDEDEQRGVIGLYRYNDKDDCVILIHNEGFNSLRNFTLKNLSIPFVDLSADNIQYGEANQDVASVGLPEGKHLEPGTVFVDALDKSKEYIVNESGNIINRNGTSILLNHTVTILKRKSE